MPAINSEPLILALALLLVAAGLAGLAPSLAQVVRRRRLVSQLTRLKVDGDEGDALFDRALAAVRQTEQVPPRVVLLSHIPEQTPDPALVRASTEMSPPLTVPAPLAATVTGDVEAVAGAIEEEEQPAAIIELAAQDELEGGAGVPEPPCQSEAADEVEDQDDIMAMFREAKVTSGHPEALEDAYEELTAASLLAQARELRDLLRRAA